MPFPIRSIQSVFRFQYYSGDVTLPVAMSFHELYFTLLDQDLVLPNLRLCFDKGERLDRLS